MKQSCSKWIAYIVTCADDTLYTGSTNNLVDRLNKHNAGKGAKYTRSRLPVKVAYAENVADKSAALKRENEIKKMTRIEKLKLIATHPPKRIKV